MIAGISEITHKVGVEAGRRLVAAGALEQVNDVFHLALVEVEMFLCGEWNGAGARNLVADRRTALCWTPKAAQQNCRPRSR